MSFIYRTAVTIARKQPYLDWANGLEDGGPRLTEGLANRRDTVYLVGHAPHERTIDDVLRDWWEDIFEEELASWTEDEDAWPAMRTPEMFDLWFDAEVANTIIDLAPDEPLTEEDVDLADLEFALETCAWCQRELDPSEGRAVGFALDHRERFEHREGRVLTLPVGGNRIVTGVVTQPDSTPASEGFDLMFRACSRACEKRLQKAVPRPLKQLSDHLATLA